MYSVLKVVFALTINTDINKHNGMSIPKKITNAHDLNSDIKCLLRVISHYIFITAVLQSFGNILLKTFVTLINECDKSWIILLTLLYITPSCKFSIAL
jgi:hypothetical protein